MQRTTPWQGFWYSNRHNETQSITSVQSRSQPFWWKIYRFMQPESISNLCRCNHKSCAIASVFIHVYRQTGVAYNQEACVELTANMIPALFMSCLNGPNTSEASVMPHPRSANNVDNRSKQSVEHDWMHAYILIKWEGYAISGLVKGPMEHWRQNVLPHRK